MTSRTPSPIKVVETLIDGENQLADFIANGPATGLPGYVRDAYRNRCDQFANLPGWAQLLTRGPAGAMNRVCEPWWASQGTDGPVQVPPFTGGQCEGVLYRAVGNVAFERVDCGNGQVLTANTPINSELNIPGPISNLQTVLSVPGPCGPRAATVTVTTGSGATRQLFFQQEPTVRRIQNVVATISFTDATGLPDDCGDPEGTLEPGPNPPTDPGPTPGPEPTDDPQNPFGPPLLPIPPYDDPVGGPTPIDAPVDPEPFDPTAIPATGGDGLPGVGDAIADPAGTAEGGDDGVEIDFGPPPAGRIWVGCAVVAMVDPRIGNIPGTGPINTVFPRTVGNVSLKFGAFFGTMQRVNSRFTLLFRENSALIVNGCFLQAQPGATLVVNPISAPTCPESPCEE